MLFPFLIFQIHPAENSKMQRSPGAVCNLHTIVETTTRLHSLRMQLQFHPMRTRQTPPHLHKIGSLGLMHYLAALFFFPSSSPPISGLAILLWQINSHPPRRQPCPLVLIHHTPNARIISFQQGRIHPLSLGVLEILLSLRNLLCHCGLMIAAIGGGVERAANTLLNWGGRRERPMRDFTQNGPVQRSNVGW